MKLLFLLLSFYSFNSYAKDTLNLYYDIDQSVLTTDHKKTLNTVIGKKETISKVEITGYTDYLGSNEYNLNLSKGRARGVKNYLKNSGITNAFSTGKGIKGEHLDHNMGIRKNRTVEIIIYYDNNEGASNEQSLQSEIKKMEAGEKLVLKNFNFIPGRHFLLETSKPELVKLVQIMQDNPTLKIELQGHICCQQEEKDGLDWDTQEYNLSVARAKYIYDQLLASGISPDRLTYKGFARTQPLFPLELNEDEMNANRRVEILIIEK